MMTAVSPHGRVGIEIYWLPRGAGGNFVHFNGRVYEAIKARLDRRPVCDLYHSALQVFVPEGRYVVENTPVIDCHGRERGVVIEGCGVLLFDPYSRGPKKEDFGLSGVDLLSWTGRRLHIEASALTSPV